MGVIPNIEHQSLYPHMFAFLINIKHSNYTTAEKLCISKSGRACLNPTVLEKYDDLQDVIKMESGVPIQHQIDQDLLEEQKIEILISSLKSSNAGYEDIMHALKPYIQMKNISKKSEERLMHFIQELIEQRNEQNRRQYQQEQQ